MMRNEPVGEHHAHLFRDTEVSGVQNQYDVITESVPSLCGRRNSYGPFARLGEERATGDPPEWLCGRCVQIWQGELRARSGSKEAEAER